MRAGMWVVAAVLGGLTSPAAAAPIALAPLALSGQPVPGLPGETFSSFRLPRIGATGRAAFAAEDPQGVGFYAVDDAGALVPILHQGDAAPGIPGAQLSPVGGATPLASGRVGVSASLYGTTTADRAFWVWSESGGTQLVAALPNVAENLGGAEVVGPSGTPGFTPTEVVYPAVLSGSGVTPQDDEAVFRSDPSRTRVLLREGDPTPGMPGYQVAFTPTVLAPDDRDERVITASVAFQSGQPWDFVFHRTSEAGTLERWFATDQLPEGVLQGLSTSPFPTNDAFAFTARIAPSGSVAPWTGLWAVDSQGALRLAARDGDALDGAFTLQDLIDARPVFDAAGQLAFEADAVDATLVAHSSIMLHDPATGLELIARSGGAVPGLLDTFFAGVFGHPQMDAAGDVVFWGELSDPTTSGAHAVFVRRADGSFDVVAREGQRLEVAPGDVRTIASLMPPPLCLPEDCRDRVLSDDRRLVLALGFDDATSGVFLVSVPEPSAGVVALAVLALAAGAPRKPRDPERHREQRRR